MKSKLFSFDFIVKWIFLSIFLFLFLFFSSFYYAKYVSSNISSKIFRLHIVANSDLATDQILKLKVRDAVLKYMNSLIDTSMTKDEITKIATKNLSEFKTIALNTLNEYGYNYDVSVEVGNFFFPTKKYGNAYFPDGNYDALNIKIGSASGHNWWCVMFPPLCFIDTQSGVLSEESEKYLKNNLSDEDINIITQENNSYVLKFKTIEIINNIWRSNVK